MNHVTKENLLALIESVGRELSMYASPGYYSFEERGRAKSYDKPAAACRVCYRDIRDGADPLTTLLAFKKNHNANRIGLIISAVRGELSSTIDELAKGKPENEIGLGHRWATVDGDLYSVSFGNRLNLPQVQRLANTYLPEDKQNIAGSRRIADALPNPCTRVTMPARAC